MNNEHYTMETLAFFAMQGLSEEGSDSIRRHLDICLPCRTDLGQLSVHLALMGFVVPERDIPSGARQRFIERVAAASAPVKPQDPGSTNLFEISTKRLACKTIAGANAAIKKKSLLSMKAPLATARGNKPSHKPKVDTVKPAPYWVRAARIVNIL